MTSVEVRYLGASEGQLAGRFETSPGQTINEVVDALGISASDALVPMVNGEVASWDYRLQEGDRLHLIQVIGGG